MFNFTQDYQINTNCLDEIPSKPIIEWMPSSKDEFRNVITKCSDLLSPELDKILWKHIKYIIKDNLGLNAIVNIANICINLEHWLNYFKISTSIIIPKPNKMSYNSSKYFCPIVLLNTLGKLIEKIISERLQFQVVSKNFIHPNQLEGLKQ